MEEDHLDTEVHYDGAGDEMGSGLGAGAGFEAEMRDFMSWTRDTLQCIKESVHDLDKHQSEQNGSIRLVMERERETHDCATKAHDQAEQNARDIVALRVGARANKEHDRQREGEMRSEVKWLRDNVWKIALGGVSVLALLDEAAALLQRIGAP